MVLKLWGAPLGGAVVPRRGEAVVCIRNIFILNEIRAQDKIYIFWEALPLVKIFYLSPLVPVLAPNYKQHISSPAKVRFLSVLRHADE
jgi:hypothetical protein